MREYDPLSVDELGRSAARALMDYPPDKLPPTDAFTGAGVYTLNYMGKFPAYQDLGAEWPIYVGKADPPGRRQGRTAVSRPSSALYSRLIIVDSFIMHGP